MAFLPWKYGDEGGNEPHKSRFNEAMAFLPWKFGDGIASPGKVVASMRPWHFCHGNLLTPYQIIIMLQLQ